MKVVVSGLLVAAAMLGLSACAPAPAPPPPPPPAIGAPPPPPPAVMPPPPPPAVMYRGCGPHRHWVRAHRSKSGRWIRGHCAPNRRR